MSVTDSLKHRSGGYAKEVGAVQARMRGWFERVALSFDLATIPRLLRARRRRGRKSRAVSLGMTIEKNLIQVQGKSGLGISLDSVRKT